MKIFTVDFTPLYPVPFGLIIAANNKDEAIEIAKKTIEHTSVIEVTEVNITEPCVIFYESGNY